MSNTFGTLFKLTSFGESHGKAYGGVIDGCPAGLKVDFDFVFSELNRRKPGKSLSASARREDDEVEFISGIFEGVTLGTPIAFLIRNKDAKPDEYDSLKNIFRPSHADYTYMAKYGIRDHRGGGRSSARETVVRVVAGALAKMILKLQGIHIIAFVSQIGDICIPDNIVIADESLVNQSTLYCPDKETGARMEALLTALKEKGDSTGGVINCVIRNVPAGVGEPVFGKLQSALAHAMLSINAAKGFEYGLGFKMASMMGSEVNDEFVSDKSGGRIKTKTNFSGGIQGGISNGEEIFFRVAFKPVPTIMKEQSTIDTEGNSVILKPGGRHDVCVVPRAIPVVEAMAALVLVDQILLSSVGRLKQ